MSNKTYTVFVETDGSIRIPAEILKQVQLQRDGMARLIVEDNQISIVPMQSRIPALVADIVQIMKEEGVTLDDLLNGLEEDGDEFYKEYYGKPIS